MVTNPTFSSTMEIVQVLQAEKMVVLAVVKAAEAEEEVLEVDINIEVG